jgi:hypothetical protein
MMVGGGGKKASAGALPLRGQQEALVKEERGVAEAVSCSRASRRATAEKLTAAV